MLLELLITLTSGLLLVVSVLVISRIISDRLALIRFKKLSKGLPICPDARLAGNHTLSLMFREDNCEILRTWHEELGETIGWLKGVDFAASTIDLDLIKTFIQDEPELHLNRMKLGLPMEEFENSIMEAPKDEWRHLRRVIAPALTSNKFKTPNVQREIESSISKLIGHIEKKLANEGSEAKFEIDKLAHKYSLNLMFSCFYKQYNLIDFDNPNDEWSTSLDESFMEMKTNPIVRLSMVFPMFNSILDWLALNFTKHGLGRKRILDFVKLQLRHGIEARKQLEEFKKEAAEKGTKIDEDNFILKDGSKFSRNMIDHIIDQFLDGKLTKEQYFNNCCFLLGAADKTSADCIVQTIYLLSINQDVQQRLIDSIKADGIESEYLDWVIKESLRLLPPASVGCSRLIGRDIATKDGHVVPKGTFIHTNAFVIHRLKKYWGDDANEFNPERWRDTSAHHPFQYLPFGAGAKQCPGKSFAINELKLLFAALLTRYKFEGRIRRDAYDFHSPLWLYILPKSATEVIIRRLDDCSNQAC